jgi:glycosyltransferase involved in cell wall biosynthesis
LPTTVVTTSASIGIGVMAQEMVAEIPEVDSVILIDYDRGLFPHKIKNWNKPIIARSDLGDVQKLGPIMAQLSLESGRKFAYIETSWGLSKYAPPSRNFLIPMWEQDWFSDAKYCDNIICITKKTLQSAQIYRKRSRYLPFPVSNHKRYEYKNTKIILHNAGSFGGSMRKGTPEAVQIFQRSNLSERGYKLKISCWSTPEESLLETISLNPDGIIIDQTYKVDWRDNFQGVGALLFPSRTEGHALSILEAYAFGIPVFCTDAPPINEYEHDLQYLLPVRTIDGNRSYIDVDLSANILGRIDELDLIKKSESLYNLYLNTFSWNALRDYYSAIFR